MSKYDAGDYNPIIINRFWVPNGFVYARGESYVFRPFSKLDEFHEQEMLMVEAPEIGLFAIGNNRTELVKDIYKQLHVLWQLLVDLEIDGRGVTIKNREGFAISDGLREAFEEKPQVTITWDLGNNV